MRRLLYSVGLLGLAVASALAIHAQPGRGREERHSSVNQLKPEDLTRFEQDLLQRARKSGVTIEGETRAQAENNARGIALASGNAAVVDFAVSGRKYGISLDGTGDVLIKNFSFVGRHSKDRFGSGIILGQKVGTRGETWLSNAWIDLKERGPDPDYQRANNEAISVERGNGPLNIRRTVMIGAQEAGIDNKGLVRVDASFIASGHRPLRIWNGARVVIANSTILAFEGFAGIWFGGGEGVATLEYHNCRFGRVGDPPEALTSDPPDWMIAKDEDDAVTVRVRRLESDPFNRKPDGFWIPARAPVPRGYLG